MVDRKIYVKGSEVMNGGLHMRNIGIEPVSAVACLLLARRVLCTCIALTLSAILIFNLI